MKVAVEVTAEDIRIGRRYSATRCPVRRAMRRAGIQVEAVFATGWMPTEHSRERPMPRVAGRWIARYDSGSAVEPFSFEVAA
jgi:hypothetical protein